MKEIQEELEKQKFIKLTGEILIKFQLIEYKLETDSYIAKWKIEIPEENPFGLKPSSEGEITIKKDNSKFSVFQDSSFKHYLFVLDQIQKGETNLDYIHTLWREYRSTAGKIVKGEIN